jgi:hypothetical protein
MQIPCKLNELRIIIEYVKILVAYGWHGFGAVRELGKYGNSNFVKQFTSEPACKHLSDLAWIIFL